MIPLSVPNISDQEITYATQALGDAWVSTGGPFISRFEEAVASFIHADGAVACQSGTAGLHLALCALGVGPGDLVLVPALTFIAAVNPVRYLGADPIFLDCDAQLVIDPVKLDEFLRRDTEKTAQGCRHRPSGRLIKALVLVHVFGNVAHVPEILALCRAYDIRLVEDATEALGSHYSRGPLAGAYAGTFGDAGVFSFNGNKIITTGGGGMVLCREAALREKIRYLSTQAKDDGLYYRHDMIGYNYRMTNLQAAVGLAQMERLPQFIKIKRRNYGRYREAIHAIRGLDLLPFNNEIEANYWFYSLLIDRAVYGCDRDELLRRLLDDGIQTRPIWGLICDQKPYQGAILAQEPTVAREYHERILNLPCSTGLDENDVDFVCARLRAHAAGTVCPAGHRDRDPSAGGDDGSER